jgi:hypothetical protein
MNPNPTDQPGPDAFLDASAIAHAYAAHAAAHERLQEHDGITALARQELAKAQTARTALLQQQADGTVDAAQVAEAERAIASAKDRVTFLADTRAILKHRAEVATTGVQNAAGVAALPIAREGAKRRIAAARAIAAAQAALKAAEQDYDTATAFLQVATARGWRPRQDVAVDLAPAGRQQTLYEQSRLIPQRGTPEAQEALFHRAGLIDTPAPAAAT